MPLTNAEKQARWRAKRNRMASVVDGTPKEIADGLLAEFGPDKARKIARALDKRLRTLKRDCRLCNGTGFAMIQRFGPCGLAESVPLRAACDCSAEMQAMPTVEEIQTRHAGCEL
jgi:hypothetical protein